MQMQHKIKHKIITSSLKLKSEYEVSKRSR